VRRAFDTDLEFDEAKREVYGRMFPFNTVAHVREMNADGGIDEYDEMMMPGCTERMRQVAAKRSGGTPAWIGFTIDHLPGLDARLGYCTSIEERDDDGAWGTFKLYDGPQLPKVRSMLEESHKGLSIEFTDMAPPLIHDGVVRRRQINISHCTATPIPVYEAAGIVAIRSAEDPLASGTPNLDRVRAMIAEWKTPEPVE